MKLESQNLTYHQLTESDWPFFKLLHETPDVIQYVCDAQCEEEIRARFESRLHSWEPTSSHWLTLVIKEKESGLPVGLTGMLAEWSPYKQTELGFLLSPNSQRKGYGFESTKYMIELCFNQFNFHKIKATVTEGNLPSTNLLRKCGFVHEGTLRDNFILGGEWKSDQLWGLLKSDILAN
ncbi:GNAT family protein [Psychrosphaera haliotis]|uniref:GNAT family N-acetyltransferase n=1 Tax=Psychrosphaera haliotis TaxID=555083 RepID=UPI0031CE34FB